MGIDIELQCDIQIENFQPQMIENEWIRNTASFDRMDLFYNYRTQKEAVIWGCGNGLYVPLKYFGISQNIAIIGDKNIFLKNIKLHEEYKCHIANKYNG